jgi:hypothetical protein
MRILMRAHKNPFRAVGPFHHLTRDVIGGNVGNLMFSQAVYRLLSTRGATITTSKLVGLDPAVLNDQYDQVVVPLANAFRPGFADELRAMTDLIRGLSIPVVVVGVGAQAWTNGKVPATALDGVVTAFVKATLERSASLGVRGEITAAYLKRLGFSDDVVDVIGCPSMFMRGPDLSVTRKVDEITADSRISLNISPYLRAIGPFSVDQANRYPHLMYTAQDRNTLELLLTGSYPTGVSRPPDSPTSLDHPLLAHNRTRLCLDPVTWLTYLRDFDFSLGTRIHGNITALLAGIPAMVLAHDSRTLELADYHEIPHHVLPAKPDGLDAATLYACADWGPTVAGHAERWNRMTRFFDRNGLRHVYLPGESPHDFDARMARRRFPPPVEVGGTWLTRREVALWQWLRRHRTAETIDD